MTTATVEHPVVSKARDQEVQGKQSFLRERGMGASILVSALAAALGALLVTATAYIDAQLSADPFFGGSDTLTIIMMILAVILMGVSMYVAAVVTANTFSTIVAGRTRQIALKRLIGASAQSERKQVARQGLIVGAIGGVVGIVIALGLAAAFVAIATSAFGFPDVGFTVLSLPAVIPGVVVALTTWAAAWAGSRRVLTVSPLEALGSTAGRTSEDLQSPSRKRGAMMMLIFGLALLGLGVLAGLVSPIGVVVAFLGGILSFTGIAVGATIIMPPLLRFVGRFFGSSVPARLARENANRYPERSSRMAIGVVLGVALVTMFSVATASVETFFASQFPDDTGEAGIEGLQNFTTVMMVIVGVSAVIAAVGLVNLLTISVVQRKRELGLLRALGFSNQDVRKLVLFEAAHIAITSLVAGLVLGVFYGWVGAQATLGSVSVFGPSMNFVVPAIPWGLVLGVVVATVGLTLIAAVTPTRLATRVAPVEALATE